jgi:hypothetical protein
VILLEAAAAGSGAGAGTRTGRRRRDFIQAEVGGGGGEGENGTGLGPNAGSTVSRDAAGGSGPRCARSLEAARWCTWTGRWHGTAGNGVR